MQVIKAEEYLHIFWELPIQHFFMRNQFVMTWINRTYSFIHIPGSIAFLVWLFYYTNTRNRVVAGHIGKGFSEAKGSPAGPRLYEARRRTMAFCNLLAFIVFTLWPCMPPRLLSADTSDTPTGELARSYGYVYTSLFLKNSKTIYPHFFSAAIALLTGLQIRRYSPRPRRGRVNLDRQPLHQ